MDPKYMMEIIKSGFLILGSPAPTRAFFTHKPYYYEKENLLYTLYCIIISPVQR